MSAKEQAYEKHIEALEEENEELEQALLDEKGIIPEPDNDPEPETDNESDNDPDNDPEPETDNKHERGTSPLFTGSTPYFIGALALFLLLILIMRARQGRKVQAIPTYEPGNNGSIAPSNPQAGIVYPSYTSGYRQVTTTDF